MAIRQFRVFLKPSLITSLDYTHQIATTEDCGETPITYINSNFLLQKSKKKERDAADASSEVDRVAAGDASNGGGRVRMAGNKEDNDMSGYSFEAIDTERSTWQTFKALVYVSKFMLFRR